MRAHARMHMCVHVQLSQQVYICSAHTSSMKTSKPTGTRGKASGACSKCGGGGVKGWGGLREKCMGSVEGWCRVVQGGGESEKGKGGKSPHLEAKAKIE